MENGYLKGEVCGRNNCDGIIEQHEGEGSCSCHINPPCSYCTTSREHCPKCEWDGREEQIQAESKITEFYQMTEFPGLQSYHSKEAMTYRDRVSKMMSQKLPRPKSLMYVDKGHTHFTMIKEGVFPEGMTKEELFKEVQGSFGGRFSIFSPETGVFKFIAYTD